MRITHLLNRNIVISRMTDTGVGDKMAFSTVTTMMSHIQPQERSKGEISTGVFGKSYRIYMDGGINVEAGDRLRDTNNTYYTVRSGGVSRRTFGSFDYLIIICEETL